MGEHFLMALAVVAMQANASEPKADPTAAMKGLEARCAAAVAASGRPAGPAPMQRITTPLAHGQILVQYRDTRGEFICQVCDERDTRAACGNVGLMLSYRSDEGDVFELPAEIRQKCEFSLHRQLTAGLVTAATYQQFAQRIRSLDTSTEERYVFEHFLDRTDYRCSVSKSDLTYTIQRSNGAGGWHDIATGRMR